MTKDTPEGDKTQMNSEAEKKAAKKAAKKSKQAKGNVSSDLNNELTLDSKYSDLDICYDPEFDEAGNFALLQQRFNKKLLLLKTEFQGKFDALRDVIKDKDETIGKLHIKVDKLHTEADELKQSCNFLSKETTDLNNKVTENEVSIDSAVKNHTDLVNKTSDLEDRSRRNNVVFFNIPEEDTSSEPEDCMAKMIALVKELGFFSADYDLEIDRAHRLGRKQNDYGDSRPRPIIIRFCFYQDKLKVMSNGRLFKGSGYSARDDYSKLTLGIHRELVNHAKEAQSALDNLENQTAAIIFFKVTYRRLVLTFTNKTNSHLPTFTRSFSLDYIKSNKNWFMPPKRNTYSSVQNANS